MSRVRSLLMLLPIALDCLGNVCIGGSWRNTLSSEAWNHRDHPYWGWCHAAIDGLFFWQPDHCRLQAVREARYGGVWAAWMAAFSEQ